MRRVVSVVFVGMMSVVLLASCAKTTPNEMSVTDGQPLSLPPNFELRPPLNSNEEISISQNSDDIGAEKILFNSSKKSSDAKIASEIWLLDNIKK